MSETSVQECKGHDDGRNCTRVRDHRGPCRYIGVRNSTQIVRAGRSLSVEDCAALNWARRYIASSDPHVHALRATSLLSRLIAACPHDQEKP